MNEVEGERERERGVERERMYGAVDKKIVNKRGRSLKKYIKSNGEGRRENEKGKYKKRINNNKEKKR